MLCVCVCGTYRISYLYTIQSVSGLKGSNAQSNIVHPKTSHEGPEGEKSYSSTLSLLSQLDKGGRLTPLPCRFILRKETGYPSYGRLSGYYSRSGRVHKISPSPELDLQTA